MTELRTCEQKEATAAPAARERAEMRLLGAPAGHKTRISIQDGNLVLRVPAPELHRTDAVQAIGLLTAGALALVLAFGSTVGGATAAGGLVVGACGLALVGCGAYLLLRAVLDITRVAVGDEAIVVVRSFPFSRTWRVPRRSFHGIHVGRKELLADGYTCTDWSGERPELVVVSENGLVSFGSGLPSQELKWLKEAIEDRLEPVKGERALPVRHGDGQPPEIFWRQIARSSTYALAGSLLLLLLLVAAGVQAAVVGSVFALVLLLATVVFLSYRSYRLEQAAAGWHRAVIRYQASLMELEFSEDDEGRLVDSLPDFGFFRGPHKLYNVAWSREDPERMMLFDYTSGARHVMRDGAGCALRIPNLSTDRVSLKPRSVLAARFPAGGIRLPESPGPSRLYKIEAENAGRARALLGGDVIEAIKNWQGAGQPPWVCIRDGVLGLSVRRRQAEQEKAARRFYEYALALRGALQSRLSELRRNGQE